MLEVRGDPADGRRAQRVGGVPAPPRRGAAMDLVHDQQVEGAQQLQRPVPLQPIDRGNQAREMGPRVDVGSAGTAELVQFRKRGGKQSATCPRGAFESITFFPPFAGFRDRIRAGMIGEIGLSTPPVDVELRVLKAAGSAHLETGAPIIHQSERKEYSVVHRVDADGG
jgi:phosphotriesterase family protein